MEEGPLRLHELKHLLRSNPHQMISRVLQRAKIDQKLIVRLTMRPETTAQHSEILGPPRPVSPRHQLVLASPKTTAKCLRVLNRLVVHPLIPRKNPHKHRTLTARNRQPGREKPKTNPTFSNRIRGKIQDWVALSRSMHLNQV